MWDNIIDIYSKKGYSEEWINQRLKTIDIRKEFTDELKEKGIKDGKDFAILTNILTQVIKVDTRKCLLLFIYIHSLSKRDIIYSKTK